MYFLGAVFIEVILRGGWSSTVAFHISQSRQGEVIAGTNSLSNLGVNVHTEEDSKTEIPEKREKGNVVVVCGIYIPPWKWWYFKPSAKEGQQRAFEWVMRSIKEGASTEVYSIQNQHTAIPFSHKGDRTDYMEMHWTLGNGQMAREMGRLETPYDFE
ncbi:unnamed protein product [Nippostrongylus brasiliensis]|uniref:BBE domain-containing protein n=1 Tax=Nippostrongylus brasiliensis TaxID=27835 RepID=A0A0N4YMS1_NIPBR|nr:unnamed protein product [Nippostrongylus brasiliensis]